MTDTTTADKPEAPTDAPTGADRVDLLGLALQLESSCRKVDSRTARRAMLAAAQGLRMVLMGATPIHDAEDAARWRQLMHLSGARKRIWNHVLDSDMKDGHETLEDAIDAARAKEGKA